MATGLLRFILTRYILPLARRGELCIATARGIETRADPLLTVGPYTYGLPKILRWDASTKVSIGSFCSLASHIVVIAGGNHRTDWITTFPLRAQFNLPGAQHDGTPTTRGDITIGSDVWIGEGAVILSGVTIGHGAVIGAYSVVTKTIPPYHVAAGNPASIINKRFTDEQIEQLLAVKWWDWPLDKVLQAVPLLSSGEVDRFLQTALVVEKA